jgi:hypothetical protein
MNALLWLAGGVGLFLLGRRVIRELPQFSEPAKVPTEATEEEEEEDMADPKTPPR